MEILYAIAILATAGGSFFGWLALDARIAEIDTAVRRLEQAERER